MKVLRYRNFVFTFGVLYFHRANVRFCDAQASKINLYSRDFSYSLFRTLFERVRRDWSMVNSCLSFELCAHTRKTYLNIEKYYCQMKIDCI